MELKNRRPDPSVRGEGVTYISTCIGINFHPIHKPFEMGAYLSGIKSQIFYLIIGCLKVEILGIFKKSLTDFELLGRNIRHIFLKKWQANVCCNYSMYGSLD